MTPYNEHLQEDLFGKCVYCVTHCDSAAVMARWFLFSFLFFVVVLFSLGREVARVQGDREGLEDEWDYSA